MRLYKLFVFSLLLSLTMVHMTIGVNIDSSSPDIAYGDPLTLGMKMGNFELDNPWIDPCDWYSIHHQCPIGYVIGSSGEGCPCVKESDVISANKKNMVTFPTSSTLALSQSATEWYDKAISYVNDKKFELALNAINQAIAINPTYKEAWGEKGYILVELQRYSEALTACGKAIDLGESEAYVWTNKGSALNELKRYNEALNACDKALSLDPEFVHAWNNKGNALWGLKKYQDAYSSYQKAIQLDPSFNLAKENLELLMSEQSSTINQKAPIDNSHLFEIGTYFTAQKNSNAVLEMRVVNPEGTYNALDNMYDYSVQIIFKNIGGKAAHEISVYIKDINEEEILDQYSISIIESGKEYPDNPAEHSFRTKKKGFSVTASYYDSDEYIKVGESKLNTYKIFDVD